MKQLPESINITEFGIEINWDKQNKHIYPFKYLRLQCSCAGCVEEMTGKKLLDVQNHNVLIFLMCLITLVISDDIKESVSSFPGWSMPVLDR